MGISRLTAMEIFMNPGDLEITIGQEEGGTNFAISISRGPGHNYKLMLSSLAFAESRENAIKAIGEILQTVHKRMTEEFKNSRSLASQYLSSDSREIDPSKVLNQDLIKRILEELRAHGTASTCKMHVPVG